jgi:outer membrane protein TolC
MIAMRKPLARHIAGAAGQRLHGRTRLRPPAGRHAAGWRLSEQDARDLANTAWWEQLDDPVLNDLVATALRENKDLMIAAARVEEFAGNYGIRSFRPLPAGRRRL